MSIAPLLTKCLMLSTICAGQERFGQRTATSPLSRTTARAARRARLGHAPLGQGRVARGARHAAPSSSTSPLVTGPTTCGITSPARCTTTSSPSRMSLRRMSSSLCRVARSTVTPPTLTGSRTANGVSTPVRPTLTAISRRRVVAVVGANLKAIAQRGSWATDPRARCRAYESTLTTTPSMS